ncbi:hypothetical protein SPRG_19806 [Saprolegnia parasitica CBS 223.65]|uniref:Choline transporter-like protein n=1 Tax=Saprolegnia parasitica (strain CBS 223.65) TaxID=695850 RepID=A0A067CM16_SAPPC|nr:hypothetical protein SPRG_19806 [Saprolegnia parasitica CBS 223.65]KDO30255.1 hypothetical protein SPRG_19806 [Saprolegnia parasitica CBS 223.65]|eukprot:XP_012199059.1 hypothetical protein SPRG_19806 [Saprolegnia parasitica CBS 223.65]
MKATVVPTQCVDAAKPVSTGPVSSLRPTVPPSGLAQYRDWPFAVLFVINVLAILVVALLWGAPSLDDSQDASTSIDVTYVGKGIGIMAAMFVVSLGLSALMVLAILKFPAEIITFGLWTNLTLCFLVAVLGLVTGILVLVIIGGLSTALFACYMYGVRDRLAFAAANLRVAAAALVDVKALVPISFLLVLLQLVWTLVWFIALYGIFVQAPPASTPAVPAILLSLSLLWGISVLKNINVVTIAGGVASWWYGESAAPTAGALQRATTTSLGSICLGSLLVAILQVLQQLLEMASRNGGVGALVARCLMSCLVSLFELFSHWAFVYVGVYGNTFVQAGKATMQLFHARGFTALLNDELISSALAFSAFVVALICSGVGVAVCAIDTQATATLVLVGLGSFFMALAVALVVLSTIDGAVATVYVCFAEHPEALGQSHPELFQLLMRGWHAMYPDIMASAGYPLPTAT